MSKNVKSAHGGAAHYAKEGLKPVVVFVAPSLHGKLKKLAETNEHSLQITVRRILEQHFENQTSKD